MKIYIIYRVLILDPHSDINMLDLSGNTVVDGAFMQMERYFTTLRTAKRFIKEYCAAAEKDGGTVDDNDVRIDELTVHERFDKQNILG